MMDRYTAPIRRRDRKVLRLKSYDYSKTGGYFITICTHNRRSLFGEVINQEMWLNEAGEINEQWWLKLRNKFSKISLDSYIIMPNHLHGIIMINSVGAIHELPLLRRQMLIPKMVGYFKMNSAKYINKLKDIKGIPLWQRNYYERIIRNENELSRIREYIQNNPLKWDLDRENPLSKNFNRDHGLYWKEIYYSK
jgi:REP element-mobilizing transposase RayT